ncbi:unnamed protein product [Ostreobium quekettii]|uniref:Zinc finger LSD1-type domain-containing protein n=1 Tax=Ostreobium quekettii TaxID=121088 RepID=A0A8S1IMZ4_9CHLO|nr:unnamed protein product [Ostreobium quekettii]
MVGRGSRHGKKLQSELADLLTAHLCGFDAAGPQSQIRCGRCGILLLYPQGASNVRCSQCSHITPVTISGGPESAQLVCSHCRMLLVYPRGASTVQCSICHTLNPASQVSFDWLPLS